MKSSLTPPHLVPWPPRTLTITFETEKEISSLFCLLNHTTLLDAIAEAAGDRVALRDLRASIAHHGVLSYTDMTSEFNQALKRRGLR